MNPGVKLVAYGLLLVGVFGAGAAVGAAVGPIAVGGTAVQETHDTDEPHDTHPEADSETPSESQP